MANEQLDKNLYELQMKLAESGDLPGLEMEPDEAMAKYVGGLAIRLRRGSNQVAVALIGTKRIILMGDETTAELATKIGVGFVHARDLAKRVVSSYSPEDLETVVAGVLSKAVIEILHLNAWLHDHYHRCLACQELKRKDPGLGGDEVCGEYADKHENMSELLVNLSLRDLEALSEITKMDSFAKYETGISRSVQVLLEREHRKAEAANTIRSSQAYAHQIRGCLTENSADDVGPQVLDSLLEQMQIDPKWSVREPRQFTWWGHRLAQRVWAEPVRLDEGYAIVRIHAETDLLKGVPRAQRTFERVSAFNALGASMSAFIFQSNEQRLALHCAADFHAENEGWPSAECVPRLLPESNSGQPPQLAPHVLPANLPAKYFA